MGDPDRAESLQPPDARVRLAVPAERVFDFDQDVESCDLAGDWVQAISCVTTGMISQNNTPSVFLPLLKRFDREIWYRDYVVLVAEKPP